MFRNAIKTVVILALSGLLAGCCVFGTSGSPAADESLNEVPPPPSPPPPPPPPPPEPADRDERALPPPIIVEPPEAETAELLPLEEETPLETAGEFPTETPISVSTHAYDFLNTATDFSQTVPTSPGLQTYVLIPEARDASELFTALFESTRSVGDVLADDEFTIDQINVFYLPIKGSFAGETYAMGPGNVSLVSEAYDHAWASRALEGMCASANDNSSCDGLSGGPYLLSTLTPIQSEGSEDPGPSEFIIWDMGAMDDRGSWSEIIGVYKAAALEAATLSELAASREEFSAAELLDIIEGGIDESGAVEFPESLVLRTLTTAGGCSKSWQCRIVCEL